MTRDKAIEAMDALVAKGYIVTVTAAPCDSRFSSRHPETGAVGQWDSYQIGVSALGFDSVDLRALMAVAEGVGLEARYSMHSGFHLDHPDERPESVRLPRQHPR